MTRISSRLFLPLVAMVVFFMASGVDAYGASCSASHSTTLASSSKARIYKKNVGTSGKTNYYGCWRATGRRTLLSQNIGEADFSFAFTLPKLAGRYAAFSSTDVNSAGEGGTTVFVFNLRTRHETVSEQIRPTGSLIDPVEWSTDGLVLTKHGFIAWIASSSSAKSVSAFDSSGRRELDSGADIDTSSLTRSGSVVSWTKGGVTQSATLS